MLAKDLSIGLCGIDGYMVNIEADISNGLPKFDIVGLGDTAIKESKERVKSAIKNSGYEYPMKSITVNLAPADKKKEGPSYDLGIAVAILGATNQIPYTRLDDTILLGELSLNGDIRKVNGVLPILIAGKQLGFKKYIIPNDNYFEASFITGISVKVAKTLKDVVLSFTGEKPLQEVESSDFNSLKNLSTKEYLDMKNVKGQQSAKRALEIAAAGGHNVLMIGPPGSGKTMLAKCFPSILPDLTFDEALEITKIHSIAGELDLNEGIVLRRPIRAPHHTASVVGLVGGGTNSKPGEVSLAHNGVLFLDELPEYPRQFIETLRQPLEDGQITITRANQTICYPSSFILIASMNPCPCGNYGSKNECHCTPSQIHRYLSKLSGPIMDRIDLHIEVDSITYEDINSKTESESSKDIKQRVDKARNIQRDRFVGSNVYCNSKMSPTQTRKYCALNEDSRNIMALAFDNLNMSARAHDRILKVARTIADLDGESEILPKHIAEAIQYRSLDRKYWI